MYKTGILNSEISKLLSDLGHTDQIIIADCGLPVPQGVKKIDLALDFGKPSFLEVFHIIKNHMVIEQVTIANEMIKQNDDLYIQLVSENIDISTVSHEQLKADSEKVKAIIRTGEAKPFANAILKSGVLF
ncbi:D-ribose pyranase [Staphylococcus pseudoxylosus]|uniref:D-ribose pyranase n=1 Tax=Staphylococcus pseudoxylosus TaxID=2282419 RepID=A0AAQ0MFG5_9STAP|nr:D-ribose pyranase [Staphylococcus pseudoxylosus]PTI81173.1 D-ribose pyranase [Staphylococcus xylosus]MBM2658984.1 D-ribose pyranase [Staphylococcus pseudoxylosus]MCE5003394.1 D-ribose pyranase [Staphylococcus pseudoxylosus]MDW8546668.1 D-ribose pyranase [Staphylococcus pseudoxylosus]MEB5783031.1 D-ribose pyranase [Staphylococcus pseudoxylosus]